MSADTNPITTTAQGWLVHLPLPLFAAPMGLGGLGLAWREAARDIGAPAAIGEGLLVAATTVWVLLVLLHLVRLVRHPEALAADLRHPVRSAFAGAVTIGLMLVSGAIFPYAPDVAAAVWSVAVCGHVAIAVWTVRGLLAAPREAGTLAPPLMIPLVGNVLAPVIGAQMGFMALSWMMFGIGTMLWMMLQPILLHRVIVGPPLPERLRPTLVIFLAPPSVGAIALAALTGGFGPGPLAAYGLAVVTTLALLGLVPVFARIPFSMSWWGWTFPAAAMSAATTMAIHAHGPWWLAGLSWVTLGATTLIVALVTAATMRAVADGTLFRPEG